MNELNGILCIDKPADFTSFDVVAKMRGILKTRKIGHTGTLDPMATGVLPLLIGNATKLSDIMPVQDKRYLATFRLGITTDTQDITGKILSESDVNAGMDDVQSALTMFTGEISQLPPMYSAVQVNGTRLYDLARNGAEVEREPRRVFISHAEITGHHAADNSYTIDVLCSKGTYIRTICHDLGQQLGCGATVTALRRTMACDFTLNDCVTIAEAQLLSDKDALERFILPIESVFSHLPELRLTTAQTRLFVNGIQLSLKRMGITDAPESGYSVYSDTGAFLAIACADFPADALVCKKWLAGKR